MSCGLMVVGTSGKCGKTVACAGIAASLIENGFQVIASKPLVYYDTPNPPLFNEEQRFIDRLARPLSSPETVILPGPQEMSNVVWKRLLEQLKAAPYPLILETPGSLASPLRYNSGFQEDLGIETNQTIINAIDLARILNLKILLVTPASKSPYAEVAMAASYLAQRQHGAIGWISVETNGEPPNNSCWDQESFMVGQDYHLPYFGNIGYSSSISVTLCQHGNLLRQTEMGVDLLPIQQAMEMALL